MKQIMLSVALLLTTMALPTSASTQTNAQTGATTQVDKSKKASRKNKKDGKGKACKNGDRKFCRETKDCPKANQQCSNRKQDCGEAKPAYCYKTKENCCDQAKNGKPTKKQCGKCPRKKSHR